MQISPPNFSRIVDRAKTDSQFRFSLGLAALILISFLMYLPVLAGYVPFPADAVVNFPAWDASDRLCCAHFRHAEQGDYATQYYPWHDALDRALHSGTIPLWNRQMLMGTPFEAEPLSAVFFPLNWLYGIFGTAFTTGLLFPLRTAIMTVTMAILVRRLGATVAGSMLSGLTFALCGWFMAWQGSPQIDSAMWLPLIFLSVDILRANVAPRAIALVALAFALPVLGGHPEIAFHVILAGTSYAIYRLLPLEPSVDPLVKPGVKPSPGLYLLAFSGAGVLSLGLAAVQLLPTFEWLHYITRSLDTEWGWVPARDVVAFISRDLFSNPNVDKVAIPEHAGYLGVVALAVLPFALLWPARRHTIYFVALAIASAGVVFGIPPFYWISQHIPVLKGLPNSRLLGEVDFALAALAAFGLSAIQARCAGAAPRFPSAMVALPVSWAACTIIVFRIASVPISLVSAEFPFTLLVIAAALLLAIAAFTRRIAEPPFLAWAGVLLLADLMCAGYGRMPFVRPADIFPPNGTFDFLRANVGLEWRVSPVDLTYGTNFEMPYGLSTTGGYDFPLTRSSRLLSAFSLNPYIIHFNSGKLIDGPKGLLALTSTRFFVANNSNASSKLLGDDLAVFHSVFKNGGVEIFENKDALPIGFFSPREQITPIAGEDAQFQRVSDHAFDPRKNVITPAPVSTFFGNQSAPAPAAASVVSRGVNDIGVSVSSDRDGLLVLNEAFYPGWRAAVDGRDAPVIRANYAFMAVPVRAGTHSVRFRMAPRTFLGGAAVSGVTAVILLGLVILEGRRRKSHKSPQIA